MSNIFLCINRRINQYGIVNYAQKAVNIRTFASNCLCKETRLLKNEKNIIQFTVGKRFFNNIFNIRNNVKPLLNIPLKIKRMQYLSTFEKKSYAFKHKTVLLYLSSAAVLSVGLSYAAVPLYRIYCQATGYGGTTKQDQNYAEKISTMERITDRELRIRFEAGTSRTLQWRFKPQQKEVKLVPGETALAFYTAENLTDRPIIGMATYNVVPFDAGQYFNKIQCFCFEEQQLNPNEEVDMPVFFYIDPEFDDDPQMAKVEEIILSYTFFESSEGMALPPNPHGTRGKTNITSNKED